MIIYALFACLANYPCSVVGPAFGSLAECRAYPKQNLFLKDDWIGDRIRYGVDIYGNGQKDSQMWLECRHRRVELWEQ